MDAEVLKMREEVAALEPEPQDSNEALPEGVLVGMASVQAECPKYDAGTLIRKAGLHLFWGLPGSLKTYLFILLVLEMTQRQAGDLLFGTFEIRRPWRRVVWLGDEETAGEWKHRAEVVAAGAGLRPPGDEIQFADASGLVLLNTDHIPQLVELAGPDVDAGIVDPLANLVPTEDREGRAVKVDADNAHALRRVCRPLRQLAKAEELAIFLLHHPGASGERERGPTAWRGSADVVVEVRLDSGLIVLNDHKNRDREKGVRALRAEWTQGDDGATALAIRPDNLPVEPARQLGGTAKAMYIAARAGAGKVTRADLLEVPYPTKKAADVALRTKERAWKTLVDKGLVVEDGGVVRLLEPPEPEAS